MQWTGLNIERPDQEDHLQPWEQQMHHVSVWIRPGIATLKVFLDRQEFNEHEDDEQFNYSQWETMDRAVLASYTAPYEEYKETLIDVSDDLTKHFFIAKVKITSSCYKTKSKATTGVNNTASYILWLHTTWGQMIASNMIHCVLVLMKTTIAQAFGIKFKQCLFITLKLITRI